jgi:hypothetical protein
LDLAAWAERVRRRAAGGNRGGEPAAGLLRATILTAAATGRAALR